MITWSYLAGLFDGEGTFSIFGDKRYPHSILPYMSIAQSEHYRGFRAMTEIADFLATQGIKMHLDVWDQRGPRVTKSGQPYNRNYRTMRGTIRGHNNLMLMLTGLMPYLIIRKNSAEDLKRFLILFPPRTGPHAAKYNTRAAKYKKTKD